MIINPYDVEAFTAAMMIALDMPMDERQARMAAMRRVVAGRDVFAWASDILEGLENNGGKRRFLPWRRRT